MGDEGDSMYDFSDKTVIITGATGHLGQTVAKTLIAAGARVGLIDYKSGRLGQIFSEAETTSQTLLVEGIDAASIEAMQTAAKKVEGHFGHIDALIAAVGGYAGGSYVQDTDESLLASMFRQHVHTVLAAAHAVAPIMAAQRDGVMIFVGAQSALKAGSRNGAYSAAKAAGLRLTESLAAGLNEDGVRVYNILPGTIDTPKNREQMPNADFSKWTSAESIADVILFLITGAARAISQVAISV
jgi:NADP-dependent 3-hydroxy acid dehydrogenase YdfG